MTIPFADFFERITEAIDIRTQTALAEALGVNRSAITQAKLRNAVPQKWILALARRYALSPDWLEFGGNERSSFPHDSLARSDFQKMLADTSTQKQLSGATRSQEFICVPKISATLCAGGGSFDTGAFPVAEHPFPRQWLAKMGSPESMVFMDVVGNSMEPGIMDGDMVLVDQHNTRIDGKSIHAVGVEDAIYLKRVIVRNGAIILRSDNEAYSAMELSGDERDSFRVIGKVVWLCRDCRYW